MLENCRRGLGVDKSINQPHFFKEKTVIQPLRRTFALPSAAFPIALLGNGSQGVCEHLLGDTSSIRQ